MPDRFVRLKTFAGKFFTVTPRRVTTIVLSLAITVVLNSPAVAAGPLRVNPVNSRYFFDADGATVFLAGSYQNPYNLLNGDSWDFTSYFDYLAQHNHNFTRLWAWEQSPWMFDSNGQVTYSLQPFERTGSGSALDGGAKFDLARFNQAYFDQLRTRVIQAGQRGIYVSVILFEGFSSQRKVREVNPWLADPFQRDNNINGINADPNGNGRGEEFFSLNYPSLTALQEAFVRKIVDTLNDLDNVLYEISGDTLATSLVWQYHMIDYLKQYQSSKANQHPVGMSQFYARKLAEVLNSRADWVVTQGTDFNPPLINSNKVVLNEGHPVLFTYSNPDQWVWRAFTRGYNLIYPEAISDDAGVGERVHAAIGQSRAYSQFLNLRTMFPSTTLCSKDFCLGSQGSDYLVYLPSGGQVSIDLSAATVNFLTAWFDPVTGQTISGNSVSGGKRTTFTSPIRGQSILQISPERPASGQTSSVSLNSLTPSTSNTLDFVESSSASQEMVSTPTITPNGGIYSGSVRVSLSTKTPKATIYYTTDGTSPTQSSKKYTGSFTVTGSILVKAKAFKNGKNPSAESSAWFADINSTSAFNFTLANSGDKSVSAGSSTATTITATLGSAISQNVSFAVSGLPSGATGAFSSASCTPACSSTLTVGTSGSTPVGKYPVSVSASGGGQTRTTSFNLSVSAAPFDFTLANSGDKSVSTGSSTTTTITATLSSASSQSVSFAVSGLPSGATGAFSSASCTPACSSTLTVSTSGSTPAGNYLVSVSASGGGQARTTSFNLNVSTVPTSTPPPTTTGSWTSCALEGYQCSFSGTKEVRYGINGSYFTGTFSNGVACSNSVFGDPISGYVKECHYRDITSSPTTTTTPPPTTTTTTGRVFYVSKSGSNSYSCSQAQSASSPRLTITGGISCLSSGDTLVVEAGTYTDSLEAVNIPGGSSWSAPTVIKRFGTDTVRIKPTSGNFVMSLQTAQQHHIEFDGLIFDGTGGTTNSTVKITWSGADPSNHAHHIRFRNSEFMSDGTGGRNGLVGGEDGLEVINSYFHDVDYGIYWGGKNALIEGTRFENGRGYALHFYCVSGCDTSNAVVRNNLMKNFGMGPACTAALLFANGTGHQAYNNEIVGQGGPCGGGIALYYSSGNTQIYNNTIHNNAGVCIDIAAGHSGAVVRDNIFYQNGGNIRDNGNGTLLSNNVYN